ncbi:Replication-associated recombination protein A [uncultured delta proteobacterium]|uniref:Replication-associated recombination protein A n=1 Tax=uncultured delta proteobacterium TaxID=34034 RepID=A0A212J4L6_9DELT|nr:Replication-associated recombination protein A [uncultured delta proteobacterium]
MSILAPLPERLRPDDLTKFVGQDHLKAKIENLLRAKRLPSLLLFGPPGCGKSTLALLLARAHGQKITRISAPEAGLTQLRKMLAGTDVLILDELHRFSKAQQDFFLPILESGELTLIATTTENPSFSVTPQLLSRLHVLRLRPLSAAELQGLARRGLEDLGITLNNEALDMLASLANGDARVLLNLVEYTAALPPEKHTNEGIRESLPEIVMRHDKTGDSHYERASALIKSIRGSDPDASLYYLACLLEGGEDPRFICRRLILSASEDVGLADPQALPLAVACQQAVEFVGMPEGFIPLAETVVYLALARKSNTAYAAYGNAAREVKMNGPQGVPLHLRNATTKLQRQWGYGKDYQYPHNFPEAWVDQEYLPDSVAGKRFYYPKEVGEEGRLSNWWKRLLSRKGGGKGPQGGT